MKIIRSHVVSQLYSQSISLFFHNININAIVIKRFLKISCYERILCELIISLEASLADEDHGISTARLNISLFLFISRSKREGENDECASKNNVLNVTWIIPECGSC